MEGIGRRQGEDRSEWQSKVVSDDRAESGKATRRGQAAATAVTAAAETRAAGRLGTARRRRTRRRRGGEVEEVGVYIGETGA